MKFIEQKIIDDKSGDCFRACLASLLEDEDIPNFAGIKGKSLFQSCNEWLEPRNLQLAFILFGQMPLPKGNFIVSVKSACFPGCTHSVIAREDEETGVTRIVWNPNPQDPRGVNIPAEEWNLFYVLAVIDPVRRF